MFKLISGLDVSNKLSIFYYLQVLLLLSFVALPLLKNNFRC